MRNTVYAVLCLFCCTLFPWSASADGVDDLANGLEQFSLFLEAINKNLDKQTSKPKQEARPVSKDGILVVDCSKYPGPFILRIDSYEDENGRHKTSGYWDFEDSLLRDASRSTIVSDGSKITARRVDFTLETKATKKKLLVDEDHMEGGQIVIYVSPAVLPLPAEYVVKQEAPRIERTERVVREVETNTYRVGDYVQNKNRVFNKWYGRIVWTDGTTFRVRITASEHRSYKKGDEIDVLADEIKPKSGLSIYDVTHGTYRN